MNLGMLGAVGGAGKGLAEVGQANNMREMELFKMQAEQDMRDRAEERRMAMAGRVQQQSRAANAADAQVVDAAYGKQQSQTQADTINSSNGSSVSAEDVATANAGNPLNASQRAAYGIEDPTRSAELGAKADIALRQGNPELSKAITAQQQIEINQENATTKRELDAVKAEKEAIDKGKKQFAFAEEYETWKRTYPTGTKGSDDLSYNAFLRVKNNYLLKQAGLIQKAGSQIELNPEGADKVRSELNGDGGDETVKTYNPKTGKFE